MKRTIYSQTQPPLVTNVFLHWFMGHLIHIHGLNLSLQPIDNLVSNWALRCNIHKNIKVQWKIKVLCNDYFNISYHFSIWGWCIFSLEHLLHLCKFWTICHLVSIQTAYMTCIWTIFLNFLIMSGSIYHYYSWFLFFFTLHVFTLWLFQPQLM